MSVKIEIVVEDVEGAKEAARCGVDSIELCADLDHGGLTPSRDVIQVVCEATHRENPATKVHVLILNRADGFVPEAADIAELKQGIEDAKRGAADGVVFGALNPDGTLALDILADLCATAKPLLITHHRAFDSLENQEIALEDLIGLGIDRLLTSGKPGKAPDHTDVLKKLVHQAQGRIAIVAGGGIRENNLERVGAETGVPVLHMSCRKDEANEDGFKPTAPEKIQRVLAYRRTL